MVPFSHRGGLGIKIATSGDNAGCGVVAIADQEAGDT
jgi:hypothetical protein